MAMPPAAESAAFTFRLFTAREELVGCPYQTPWRSLPCLVFNQWSRPLALDMPGRSTVIVPADHGVLFPAGQRHRLGPQARRGRVRCRWIHIQYQWMGVVDPFLNRPLPTVVGADLAGEIAAICVRLQAGGGGLSEVAARHVDAFRLLKLLLDCTGRASDQEERIAPIAPALRFIQDHLHRPFSRAELARTMSLSQGRFHDVFTGIVGVAPMAYVAQQRFQRAQHLLATTSDEVSEIARQCGFTDPFHFSRRFKAFCGLSPSHYRGDVSRLLGDARTVPPP